jgi:pyridinium-3,5-biscarboxylic acid mononucleotide sulfurtransferase
VLVQIERAEERVRALGFRQVRVRHHGTVARLELEAAELARAVELRETLVAAVQEAGFTYVTLDLAGFRSGSMNLTLTQQ